MLPIYTRYLAPEDYGAVSLMVLVIAVIELVIGFRYSQAVPKYYAESQPEKQRLIMSTSLIVTGLVSIIGFCLFYLFASQISTGVLHSPDYQRVVQLFLVLLIGQGIEEYGFLYLRLRDKALLFVIYSLLRLFFQLSLNIWFVVNQQMGVEGVALASAITSGIFAVAFSIYIIKENGIGIDWSFVKVATRFCWPLWLTGFATLYIGSASRVFLSELASLQDVGLYELGFKFGSIILILMWQPFNQFWQIERFELYKLENRQQVFSNIFTIIVGVLTFASVGISTFAKPIIYIMADPAFYQAASIVPYLTFANLLGALGVYFLFNFVIKEQTVWIARTSYATAAIMTLVFFLLIPHYGYIGAALGTMVATTLRTIIMYYVGKRYFDMGIDVGRCTLIVLSGGAVCIAYELIGQTDSVWVLFTLAALASAVDGLVIVFLVFGNADLRAYATEFYQTRIAKKLNQA